MRLPLLGQLLRLLLLSSRTFWQLSHGISRGCGICNIFTARSWFYSSVRHFVSQGITQFYASDMFFMDLEKAFDSTDRNIFLQNYLDGVDGEDLHQIEVSLQNYSTHWKLGTYKTRSYRRPSSNGVPQGSVLGPLMFLVYMNYFSQHLETTNAAKDQLTNIGRSTLKWPHC